jgi:hypothetical protein
MKKNYQSDALMRCHQSAKTLLKLGVIDAEEMKEFDKDCLSPNANPTPKTPGSLPVHPRRSTSAVRSISAAK